MGYRAVHVHSVVSWNSNPVKFSLFGITLNTLQTIIVIIIVINLKACCEI
jgi:hypothetical protein